MTVIEIFHLESGIIIENIHEFYDVFIFNMFRDMHQKEQTLSGTDVQ